MLVRIIRTAAADGLAREPSKDHAVARADQGSGPGREGRPARTRGETISRPTLGWRVTPAIRPTPPRHLPIASASRVANRSLALVVWCEIWLRCSRGGPSSEPRMAVLRRVPRPFGHRLRLRVLAVFGIRLCERPSETAWRRRARLRNVTGHWISSAPDPPLWLVDYCRR
jgi:hypothetical protein